MDKTVAWPCPNLSEPILVFSYFPFGFEGMRRDLIVSVPDHCLSFYSTILVSLDAESVSITYTVIVNL